MQKLRLFVVDAFAKNLFAGNPAAVCPLEAWLPDSLMQKIAMENNLSETAFFVPTELGFQLRWFTPVAEVNLCGHATLAAAYVLFNCLGYAKTAIEFKTLSGILTVTKKSQLLEMDFPLQKPVPCEAPQALLDAFQLSTATCLKADDYILVLESEQQVLEAQPNLEKLRMLDLRGVAITSRGVKSDYVCRFFAPNFGISEDPVTGSLQTELAPYLGRVLAKTKMQALQVSQRGGEFHIDLIKDRVLISGEGRLYLDGKIFLSLPFPIAIP